MLLFSDIVCYKINIKISPHQQSFFHFLCFWWWLERVDPGVSCSCQLPVSSREHVWQSASAPVPCTGVLPVSTGCSWSCIYWPCLSEQPPHHPGHGPCLSGQPPPHPGHSVHKHTCISNPPLHCCQGNGWWVSRYYILVGVHFEGPYWLGIYILLSIRHYDPNHRYFVVDVGLGVVVLSTIYRYYLIMGAILIFCFVLRHILLFRSVCNPPPPSQKASPL